MISLFIAGIVALLVRGRPRTMPWQLVHCVLSMPWPSAELRSRTRSRTSLPPHCVAFLGSLIALAIEIPDHGRQEIQKFAYVSASAWWMAMAFSKWFTESAARWTRSWIVSNVEPCLLDRVQAWTV